MRVLLAKTRIRAHSTEVMTFSLSFFGFLETSITDDALCYQGLYSGGITRVLQTE